MKPFKNLEEVEQGIKEINSAAAGTDRFMARCFPLMIKIFMRAYTKQDRRKRKPSKWNLYVSEGMRNGKSMKQIAKEWADHK